MKISLFDPYKGKFTDDMKRYWESQGHEVKTDPQGYYNPEMVDWADIVWFDTVSNNLISATNPDQALIDEWRREERKGEWDLHLMDMSQKKVVVRAIDIDVWSGHHASVKWDVVDHCIFIAPHIRDIMMSDSRPQASEMQIDTVPCGVDLDRWTFKERGPGNKIAIVGERWVSKGVDYALQLSATLPPNYEIHWLGKENDYAWEHEYLKDFIKRNNLNFHLHEEFVEDLDAWLEDKNYLVSCSKKEAFSYATAEGMAKGIKSLPHHFFGAEHIWPDMTWDYISEAAFKIMEEKYDSESYRQYLIDHGYTLPQMMERINGIIGI